MLSGQYDFLVNHMYLTEIISCILFILPFFFFFFNKKWLYFYYAISIVANLPLIFVMVFPFSYEAIIVGLLIIQNLRDWIKHKSLRYVTTKENLFFLVSLFAILFVNIITSLFNFNKAEVINRLIIYVVNVLILFLYTFYFKESRQVKFINFGILLGGVILVISMIIELIYGYYTLGVRNMRPAGLLLDPNVCGFSLNIVLVLSFLERKENNFFLDLMYITIRVILVFGIFLTVSRSTYIGTLFILSCYLLYYSQGKRKWTASTVTIVLILMYLVFINPLKNFLKQMYGMLDLKRIIPYRENLPMPIDNSNNPIITNPDNYDYSNSRITLIIGAAKIFGFNFITGVGIGNVTTKMYEFTHLKMNAHNLYLQLLAESGILMLIVLLLFAYYFLNLLLKVDKRFKMTIYILFGLIFIESFFNHNLLNINIIYLTLSIIVSLITISSKDKIYLTISKNKIHFRKNSNEKRITYRKRENVV